MKKLKKLSEILGFATGRNLSKLSFLLVALSISTFAFSNIIAHYLNFPIGLQVRDWIALSLIIPALMVRDEILSPMRIKLIQEKGLTKMIYFAILVIIGISISSINISFLEKILDFTFFNFGILAVRNFIALGLLITVGIIHQT